MTTHCTLIASYVHCPWKWQRGAEPWWYIKPCEFAEVQNCYLGRGVCMLYNKCHLLINLPFLFYRKRWQPGCVTKSYPLKKSKVQFPSYCRVQECDSPHGLSLLVNPWKQESCYFHKCFPSLSVFLTQYAARKLFWATWIIEAKKNQFPVSSSSFIRDKNLFSHKWWQTVLLLLKLYWNSGPWTDLQLSCFEMKLYC